MRQRIAALFAALTIASGLAVAIEAPAQAHPYDGCGYYHVCIQTVANQSGWTSYSWNLSSIPNGACQVIGAPHFNTARAVFNRHETKKARFYGSPNCTGTIITTVYPNSGYANCQNINHWPTLPRSYWNPVQSPCNAPDASSFYVYV